MLFESIMHIAFYTDRMDEMIEFYSKKLDAKIKYVTRFSAYINRDDRPHFQKIAKEDPNRIFNVYLEICPGQFIELFPKTYDQVEDVGWNTRLGYTHFALLTTDIFKTKADLLARGLVSFTELSKGPSETWQIWYKDPDGNCFEIMQFTEKSLQVVGNVD